MNLCYAGGGPKTQVDSLLRELFNLFTTMYSSSNKQGTSSSPSSSQNRRIWDFRSDTVTVPTPEMLDVMCKAQVGDDVKDEDPTVNALQVLVAR